MIEKHQNGTKGRVISTRLSQLEHHFQALADLSPEDRERYLAEQVNAAELRDRLRQLLAFDGDPATGIAHLIAAEAQHASVTEVAAGTQVGAYRIHEKIADGGMGSVYRATRADGEFEQRVAIKLLRQTLPSAEAVERFRQERQLLAALEHPGIARLLDGGTTEQGLPYLVMELVEGQAIDAYCQPLELVQRLALFQKVCAAVQAAHQSLIVHRDIKPANILVDKQGEPKLLDFGVAKLLNPQPGQTETLFAQQAMTPEYASPEQIRDLRITTATDVYSLGVLLYQLLTGVSPYARWRGQPLDLQQAICTTEPLRPSQTGAGEPAGKWRCQQATSLKADLDHIVLKAMRKEAAQRYISPAALAEDIQRYLDGLPVQARQGSWRYRGGKYLRRHALAVASAATVLLGVSALVGFYTLRLADERDLAEQQRELAQSNQQSAEQVSNFMVDLFYTANPENADPKTTAQELLEIGAQRVDAELATQPDQAAKFLYYIGRAYHGLGNWEAAIDAYRRGLVFAEQAWPPGHHTTLSIMELLSDALYDIEQWDEAEALAKKTLPWRRKRQAEWPRSYGYNLLRLSGLRMEKNSADQQVRDYLDEAFEVLARPPYDFRGQGATNLYLSYWHLLNQQYDEALAAALRGRKIIVENFGENSYEILRYDIGVGEIYAQRGDCQTAMEYYQRDIAHRYRLKGEGHYDSAETHTLYAQCQHAIGDFTAAAKRYDTVIAMEQRRIISGRGRHLARALSLYAVLLIDLGQYDLAAQQLTAASAALQEFLAKDKVAWGPIHFGYARLHQVRGQGEKALAHWQQYVEALRVEWSSNAPQIALGELYWADSLRELGRLDAAETQISQTLPRLAKVLGRSHPDYGLALAVRARLRSAKGESSAALSDYANALAVLPPEQRNGLDVAMMLEGYAQQLSDSGQEIPATLVSRAQGIRNSIASAAVP